MAPLPLPAIPISWGELLDKITILDIKRVRISRTEALVNIEKEHRLLAALGAPALARPAVAALYDTLREVNEALWEIEDDIRKEESAMRFDADFVRLARSVYKTNDQRAMIKRRINALLESDLVEEKSYAGARVHDERSVEGRNRPLVERDDPQIAC